MERIFIGFKTPTARLHGEVRASKEEKLKLESIEVQKKAFEEAVHQLETQLNRISYSVDEDVWDAAMSEMGYVHNPKPDIDGIATKLLQSFSSHLETSPYQFAHWCRKYGKIEAKYRDLDRMLSDVADAVDSAYKIFWTPQHFVQNEHFISVRKDLRNENTLEV